MKKIDVRPAEEFELRDPEADVTLHGVFNMQCLLLFQDKISEMGITSGTIGKVDLVALDLYAAVNAAGDELPYESAVRLARRMSPASGAEIVKMFNESLTSTLDEKGQQILKKMMAQMAIKRN